MQAPTDIKLIRSENVLVITWAEGRVDRIGVYDLRCVCGCAGCVDEHTGMRILDPATVPADVTITDMQLVGNYAVQFTFSDGHDTGIYSWDRLARIAAEG